jgi:hypothetical protein
MAVAIPLVALAVTTAAAAAGTAEQMGSEKASAQAQSNAATYQAQVAKNNAITAQQNATAALDEGNLKVQQQQTQGTQQLAAVRAAMGANGIQLNSGSPLAVQGGVARATQQGIQSTEYDALAKAISYQNAAQDQYSDSGLDTATAQDAISAGSTARLGTLISGVSSVSSKWASYKMGTGTSSSGDGDY